MKKFVALRFQSQRSYTIFKDINAYHKRIGLNINDYLVSQHRKVIDALHNFQAEDYIDYKMNSGSDEGEDQEEDQKEENQENQKGEKNGIEKEEEKD